MKDELYEEALTINDPLQERPVAVSNIAWAGHPHEPFLDILTAEGACGLEMAASLVWPEPVETTTNQRLAWRKLVESRGLKIAGLHSLLFSRADLQILAEGVGRREVLEYLKRTVDLCAEVGGSSLVLGGPRNRRRGRIPKQVAYTLGASILHEVGEYANRQGCFIALEALPAPKCDFITDLQECAAMVKMANTLGVRLHFDSGAAAITENNTSTELLIDILRNAYHCHVNDYDGLPPGFKDPDTHRHWASLLTTAGYHGWMSIEMRCTLKPEESLRRAIRFVRSTYVYSQHQEA